MSTEETTAAAVRLHGDVSFLDYCGHNTSKSPRLLWPMIRKVAEHACNPPRALAVAAETSTAPRPVDIHSRHAYPNDRPAEHTAPNKARKAQLQRHQGQLPCKSAQSSANHNSADMIPAIQGSHRLPTTCSGLLGHAAGSSNDRYLRQHVAGGQRSCKESISLQRTAAHAFPTVRTAMLAHPHLNTNPNCNTDKSRA